MFKWHMVVMIQEKNEKWSKNIQIILSKCLILFLISIIHISASYVSEHRAWKLQNEALQVAEQNTSGIIQLIVDNKSQTQINLTVRSETASEISHPTCD